MSERMRRERQFEALTYAYSKEKRRVGTMLRSHQPIPYESVLFLLEKDYCLQETVQNRWRSSFVDPNGPLPDREAEEILIRRLKKYEAIEENIIRERLMSDTRSAFLFWVRSLKLPKIEEDQIHLTF